MRDSYMTIIKTNSIIMKKISGTMPIASPSLKAPKSSGSPKTLKINKQCLNACTSIFKKLPKIYFVKTKTQPNPPPKKNNKMGLTLFVFEKKSESRGTFLFVSTVLFFY